ncbi:hypothetical protein EV368DRAFT_88310 [Lentinula lateritia]|nr:hypothetical protein EV368DRAFT_88310 [Lentinula lateritia]
MVSVAPFELQLALSMLQHKLPIPTTLTRPILTQVLQMHILKVYLDLFQNLDKARVGVGYDLTSIHEVTIHKGSV